MTRLLVSPSGSLRRMITKTLARLAAFLLLVNAACGSVAGGEEAVDDEHSERFVRSWLISGAEGWALLATATVYRFEGNGAISIERHIDGSYFEGPAGSWVQENGTSCWFGQYWRSVGDSTVIVDAECDDGALLEAWLQFPEDAASNSEGPGPQLITPADASPRWDGPQGQFRLCLAVEGDEFQLSCAWP